MSGPRPIVTGRLALLTAVAAVPAAVIGSWAGLVSANAVILLAAAFDLLRAARPGRIELTTGPDPQTRVDQTVAVTLTAVNAGPRTFRGRVRWAWPPAARAGGNRFSTRIPPEESATWRVDLTPARGGVVRTGPLTARSVGPWGLAGWQQDRDVSSSVMARPRFDSARVLPAKLAVLRDADGRSAARQRGEGTEFDSLREYVLGDDTRSIDWRATARRPEIMVRTWRPDSDQRLLVVIDCGRTSAVRLASGTRLSRYLDAAMLVCAVAAHAGDTVDVLAFHRRVVAEASVRGSNRAVGVIGAALTGLGAELVETDQIGMVRQILRRGRQRQIVILMTGLQTYSVARRLVPALAMVSRRNRLVVAQAEADRADVSNSADPAQRAYLLASRAQTDEGLRTAREVLGTIGVSTVSAPDRRFSEALADRYLALRVGSTPLLRAGAFRKDHPG